MDMKTSARRIAVVIAAVLALWSAGVAHALVSFPVGDADATDLVAGEMMDGCTDCGLADMGETKLVPCPAPCTFAAMPVAQGPDQDLAVASGLLPEGRETMTGHGIAPDPNPPQLSLIG